MSNSRSAYIQSEVDEELSYHDFVKDLQRLKMMIKRTQSKVLIYERRLQNLRDIKDKEKIDIQSRLDHYQLINHSGGDA